MGLAASQARLLSLTNRQHSVENQAQRLQNFKMRLSNDSDKAYQVYLNALNDTSLKTLQTNETGDTTWIKGSINNLLRYNTSDNTSGSVFYVQDIETGKLHIPEELGKQYDLSTDARDFAGKFGITYERHDLNEDIPINYNKAIENGWDTLMTETTLNGYYEAKAKDQNLKSMVAWMLNCIPSKDSDGLYQTYENQESMGSNFLNEAERILNSEYSSAFTSTELNILRNAMNLVTSVDANMYREDTYTGDKYNNTTVKYFINTMSAEKNSKTYVSRDGDKYSVNDRYEMMLNGGTAKYTATQQTTVNTALSSRPTVTETTVEDTKNIYDSATQSLLNSYGVQTYGDALTNMFTRVYESNTYLDNYLQSVGLSQTDVNHYFEYIDLKSQFEGYSPNYEYIPSDKVKGPYYEQLYNAIKSAGGWIGASDGRAQNDTWVSNMIKNAQVILTTWDSENEMLSKTSASLNTNIKEVTDNTKIEQASQDYEAEMEKINNKDTNYDTLLSSLESERSSLTTEIDALQNVIKNNVDKHFKIMS